MVALCGAGWQPSVFSPYNQEAKMRRSNRILPMACLLAVASVSFAQETDPRVEKRSYDFAFPGGRRVARVSLPYAVFVSSKVTKDKKNPLIIALHGLGGNPNTLMRGNLLDLAEAGGYIVVAPAGYNPRGWYGIPPPAHAAPSQDPGAINDPPNLTQLSEKDVVDVLAVARREFNVDERRTYLMGHSVGGAGALYLGSKYAPNWAAVAAIAPAVQQLNMESILPRLTMPVLMVQGDAGTVAAMKDRKIDYENIVVPGGDDDSALSKAMPDIFAFFNAH
jgi:poly(3-hydroxybutyrate) depolymerase